MPIIATGSDKQKKEFEPVPKGSHVARVYQIIHIGTVESTYEGVSSLKNKVRIGFEFPTVKRVFNEEKGEQPCAIAREFTLSVGDKASLKPFAEALMNKTLTGNDRMNFDVEELLGRACIVSVVHNQVGDKVYANIAGCTPLMEGMTVPKAINPPFVFGYHPFDIEAFDKLPEFLQTKIKSSLEYQQLHEKAQDVDDVVEELPF
jgi:hypothetical protein